MPRANRIEETNLEKIAHLHRKIGLQAEVLARFEREVPNYIEKSDVFAVLVADTVIAENYNDPSMCLAWLAAAHREWLRTNDDFNRMAEQLIFYRYILLPYPSLIRNWHLRQLLIDMILLHLHLQLWHGIICGVVFLDPHKSKIKTVLGDLNFLAIPSHHIFFDTPAFYRGEDLKTTILSGDRANITYKRMTSALSSGGRAPLWLHYDESNFSTQRLSGWRWSALRQFFRRLYGRNLICIGCNKHMGSFALDHIAPISQGYHQTIINFRPLCKRCNSEKGDVIREDPFKVKLLLPVELQTRELEDIQRLPPPWLGKLRSPQSLRGLTRRVSGM